VLAVTSAVADEGVTTVVRRLAQGVCGELGQAIVVDTNLRAAWERPASAPERRPGLTELLLDALPLDAVLEIDAATQLHLLPPGSGTPRASAMLASSALQRVVRQLRARYQWVLLDMPPVGLYPDAGAIARLADGVILVVEAERTRVEAVMQAQRSIFRGGGKVLGSILNRYGDQLPAWIDRYT
jgi:succinoglycan biosynthesis transport protein ExoP